MKCMNCGHENPNEAQYCEECGAPIFHTTETEEPVVTTEHESPVLPLDSQDATETEAQPVYSEATDREEPVDEPNNKKRNLWIGLGVLVAIVLVSVIVFAQNGLMKSDSEKLMDAYINTFDQDAYAVAGEVGFNTLELTSMDVMQRSIVENLVKNSKIQYVVKMDKEALAFETQLNVVLSGSDILDATILGNRDRIAISVPALYNQMIYMNWSDLQQLLIDNGASEEEVQLVDVDHIFDVMEAIIDDMDDIESLDSYEAIDKDKYKEPVLTYLDQIITNVASGSLEIPLNYMDETVEVSGDNYTLDVDMGEYMSVYMDLVQMAANDPQVKAFAKELITVLVDTLIEEEDYLSYSVIAISEDDITEPVTTWSSDMGDYMLAKRDELLVSIDEGYDAFVEELNASFNTDMDEFEEAMAMYDNMDMTMSVLVNDEKIVGTEMVMALDESILEAAQQADPALQDETLSDMQFAVEVYYKLAMTDVSGAFGFTEMPADAVDFSALSDEELSEISMEIMMNAQQLLGAFSGM